MMQVSSLHLLNFTLKAKHLVQLATVTRLQRLSLDNVTLEARNTIQKLTSLQVSPTAPRHFSQVCTEALHPLLPAQWRLQCRAEKSCRPCI